MDCSVKNGEQITRWMSYCSAHNFFRTPSAENVLVVQTPDGDLTNGMLESQYQEQCTRDSRLITMTQASSVSTSDTYDFEEMSAARCRIYQKPNVKRARQDSVVHRVMGSCHHSLDDTYSLTSRQASDATRNFPSLRERLKLLKKEEKYRVCFGKSKIHSWGLFARRSIREGEMIMEYLGEQVRGSIADLREARYQSEGKDCYISEDIVIDGTNKGNMARLLNHSCMPNCYAMIVSTTEDKNHIVLVAKTDVSAGEELMCDYLFDPGEPDEVKVPCLCNAPNCRKFLN